VASGVGSRRDCEGLGKPLPFTRHVDFLGMTDMPTLDPGKLYRGTVVQKAFVDTNEFGTEAAAATAVAMPVLTSARPTSPDPPVVSTRITRFSMSFGTGKRGRFSSWVG